MKRLICALLFLAFTGALLCGCGEEILPDKTISCDEFSIRLPGYFLDMSDQDFAKDLELVYGSADGAVSVSKESIVSLQEYLPTADAKEYAELIVALNGSTASVETVDGIPSFSYTADAEGTEFTYVVGVFVSDTHYWMVQAYCPTEKYAEKQDALWGYITSVTIN